jgi:hypothetical protein
MDVMGKPEDRIVVGNSMNSNVLGSSSQGNVYGEPPTDVCRNYSPTSSTGDSGPGLIEALGNIFGSIFG